MQPQFKKYIECYDVNNLVAINYVINNYCVIASNRFKLLKTFIADYDMKISNANSSIFVLLGIPRKNKPDKDLDFAKNLIAQRGVYLIPHSRYKYVDEHYFYFKVNLLIRPDMLFDAISKIVWL